MKKFEVNPVVYDWVFWVSIAVVVLWMILKIVGVIHSPVWQEMLPIAGGAAAIVAYALKAGRYLEKIDHIKTDLHNFKSDMSDFRKEVIGELREHDRRLVRIEAKLS